MKELIIIWLLLGIFSWWFAYSTCRKNWYLQFGTEYWKGKFKSSLIVFVIFMPFCILGGFIFTIFILMEFPKRSWSLYHKYNKK